MLDKNGNPTEAAVSSVTDYLAMKILNPRVADTMLDESAKVVAESILNGAGIVAGGIPQAIQARERRASMRPGAQPPEDMRKDPAFQTKVSDTVAEALFGGWWQQNFGSVTPYDDITRDPVQQQAFRDMIEDQVVSDYIIAGGVDTPDQLLPHAATKIAGRMQRLNGMLVLADKGVNIAAETWGAGTGD